MTSDPHANHRFQGFPKPSPGALRLLSGPGPNLGPHSHAHTSSLPPRPPPHLNFPTPPPWTSPYTLSDLSSHPRLSLHTPHIP